MIQLLSTYPTDIKMPKIIKINDITVGHSSLQNSCLGINPATMINTNVSAEGVAICVVGDTFNPHPWPLFSADNTTVVKALATGLPNVFVNTTIPVVMAGGTLTCGDTIIPNPTNLLATNVYINED